METAPGQIYKKYGDYNVLYLRNNMDSSSIIELNFFPSKDAYDATMQRVNDDAATSALFRAF
ncbi:hypothetical protein [Alicyclobacillus sp. SO9]|uniref:hypothetical protein n=1 Tax=Alicyclobacillus sp. SO9 TaxID=2665646 RepID=UPI0018E8AFF8|nr:hypothetical protein [Alicyclobacillus sp. SO9]QQE80161.1 hypothetical protein GI364_06940 [Alicyclobacillus sp. SO9]